MSSGMKLSRFRKLTFALLALGLGSLAALLLAELALRLLYREQPRSVFSQRRVFQPSADERAVFEYKPGIRFENGFYEINSHGFRGPEVSPEKQPGTFRVAALGDSYTFGESVAAGQLWHDHLGERLQQYLGQPVEVLNFGVQAYNSRNQLGLLESKVLAFEPDLVVLGHLVNDDLWSFIRNVRGSLVFHFEDDPDQRIPLPRSLKQRLYAHSLLYRLTTVWFLRQFQDQIAEEQRQAAAEQQISLSALEGWQQDEDKIDAESLRAMHRLCSERGILFAIADLPVTPDGIADGKDEHSATVSVSLQQLADELDIAYADVYPVIAGRDASIYRVAPLDHHPNAALHQLYGDYLADRWLVEGGLKLP